MAAAPDLANASGASVGSGLSLSFTANVPNGDNYLIVVEGNRQGSASIIAPASVTVNGVALLQWGTNGIGQGGTSIEVSVWYLANPPIGSFSVSISYSSSTVGAAAVAIPCSGVTGLGSNTWASSTTSNAAAVTSSGTDEFGFYLGTAFNANTSQVSNGTGQSDIRTFSSINSLNCFSSSWESPLNSSGAFSWNPTGSSSVSWYVANGVPVLGIDVQAAVARASPSASAPF